jgi:hypothetical protein
MLLEIRQQPLDFFDHALEHASHLYGFGSGTRFLTTTEKSFRLKRMLRTCSIRSAAPECQPRQAAFF